MIARRSKPALPINRLLIRISSGTFVSLKIIDMDFLVSAEGLEPSTP
jgi:hypothetical protein